MSLTIDDYIPKLQNFLHYTSSFFNCLALTTIFIGINYLTAEIKFWRKGMKKFFIVLLPAFLLAACQADINSNQYTTGSVGQANAASPCTVMSVRQVSVKSDNQLGTLIGGAAGGVAGYAIGGDSTAHLLGGIGGAVLGGMAGNAAQGALSSQSGYEYVVRLDNGQIVTITQGTGTLLTTGQKCMLLLGNPSRLIAY